MDQNDITVLVPTKDRLRDVQRLFRSLSTQTDPDFRILLVNNNGDEVRKVAEGFSDRLKINIVSDNTPNLSHLFNHGLDKGNGSIIAYLNDDTEVTSTWVEELKRAFSRETDVAAIGGPAINQHGQGLRQLGGRMERGRFTGFLFRLFNTVLFEGNFSAIGYLSRWGTYSVGGSLPFSRNLDHTIDVDALSVTNMAIRKSVLFDIGGFDEAFQFSYADGDLFVRIRIRGLRMLFDPKLEVLHYASPTLQRGETRSSYWLARDYVVFLRKLRPSRAADRMRLVITVGGFLFYWALFGVRARQITPLVSALDGVGAGLRVPLESISTHQEKFQQSRNRSLPKGRFVFKRRD